MTEAIQVSKDTPKDFLSTGDRMARNAGLGDSMARLVHELKVWTVGPLGILAIWNAVGQDFPSAVSAFIAASATMLAEDKVYNVYESLPQEKREEIATKAAKIQRTLAKRPRISITWE